MDWKTLLSYVSGSVDVGLFRDLGRPGRRPKRDSRLTLTADHGCHPYPILNMGIPYESGPFLVETFHGSRLFKQLFLRRILLRSLDLQFTLECFAQLWKVSIAHHLPEARLDVGERGREPALALVRSYPVIDFRATFLDKRIDGLEAVPSIYSSASPMGRKSALRREIAWILRRFQRRLSC